MAEPFKNHFNPDLVADIGRRMALVQPAFPQAAFAAEVCADLEPLDLKQRVARIAAGLHAHLAWPFAQAAPLLTAAAEAHPSAGLPALSGFSVWPFCHFVETYGTEDFEPSMDALYRLTRLFTAEWAIRPFLLAYPERTLALLSTWADDDSVDVRRLVSEGTRPRLPWGGRLPFLQKDPAPVLPLLQRLATDPEEYVRRSVANHLNDIAKDHPDLVPEVLAAWALPEGADRDKLIRHACRTLIKQGHAGALALLGFSAAPAVSVSALQVTPDVLHLGDALTLRVRLKATAEEPQTLVLDYAVHHRKASGALSPKVFKWTNLTLEPGQERTLERRHRIKAVTVRRYYGGPHAVDIRINGQAVAEQVFTLVVPD